jgi:hypothetical protein
LEHGTYAYETEWCAKLGSPDSHPRKARLIGFLFTLYGIDIGIYCSFSLEKVVVGYSYGLRFFFKLSPFSIALVVPISEGGLIGLGLHHIFI